MKKSRLAIISNSHPKDHKCRGFSLVELILGLGVVSILCSIVFFAVGKVGERADMARELGAGRKLIAAYLLYPLDHGGELMPGRDLRSSSAGLEYNGRSIPRMVAERYPFRLAPYLDDSLEGAIIASRNGEQIENSSNFSVMPDYGYSLLPSFGMNVWLVGGYVNHDDASKWPAVTRNEALLRQSQIDANLIVFATAGSSGMTKAGEITEGYFQIDPPISTGGGWDGIAWSRGASPERYGHLHARHNDQVIAVFLDGSVGLYNVDELRDMRLWSRNAVHENDPNYVFVINQ